MRKWSGLTVIVAACAVQPQEPVAVGELASLGVWHDRLWAGGMRYRLARVLAADDIDVGVCTKLYEYSNAEYLEIRGMGRVHLNSPESLQEDLTRLKQRGLVAVPLTDRGIPRLRLSTGPVLQLANGLDLERLGWVLAARQVIANSEALSGRQNRSVDEWRQRVMENHAEVQSAVDWFLAQDAREVELGLVHECLRWKTDHESRMSYMVSMGGHHTNVSGSWEGLCTAVLARKIDWYGLEGFARDAETARRVVRILAYALEYRAGGGLVIR